MSRRARARRRPHPAIPKRRTRPSASSFEDRLLKTSDFEYDLPPGLVAQHPLAERDAARLLVLDRASGAVEHRVVRELPRLLRPGDLLVVNDTRVLPARLFASLEGGRRVEVLLVREEPSVPPERIWTALARPARALQPGRRLAFSDPTWRGAVRGLGPRGIRHVSFVPVEGAPSFEAWLARVGHVPLPPYIARADEPEDRDRYQTIFARDCGSVAAPTAGLHFTPALLDALAAKGIDVASVTLHVGPGTFRPVATEDPGTHHLDPEPYRVPAETARAIESSRGRVVAVGTTAVRALESWSLRGRPADGAWRETDLFVVPPFRFAVVEAMLTNFHLPRSSLLMLVSAFAGRELVLGAYEAAVEKGYRFYSYGDAMLLA